LAVFIAQVPVGPRKQQKQIFQIEHNMVKNTNWPEANQLAIYKRGRGFKFGATEKQIQVVVRAGLKPRTAGLRVRLTDNSATLRNGNISPGTILSAPQNRLYQPDNIAFT